MGIIFHERVKFEGLFLKESFKKDLLIRISIKNQYWHVQMIILTTNVCIEMCSDHDHDHTASWAHSHLAFNVVTCDLFAFYTTRSSFIHTQKKKIFVYIKHAKSSGNGPECTQTVERIPIKMSELNSPHTNTFNLTVKLDFSTLPLRLWGGRSIPCHSLSCKSRGNWHPRCFLSKWENTGVHSEWGCFPFQNTFSLAEHLGEPNQVCSFSFLYFQLFRLMVRRLNKIGALALRFRERTSTPQTVCLQLSGNITIVGYFWALPVLVFVCECAW